MTIEEKHNILHKIFWDSSLSGAELYSILVEGKEGAPMPREKIFVRMVERLGWHTLLDILGAQRIQRLLNASTIAAIRQPELRERYEFIRSVLSGEPVSFTGWGDAYYQKIKHTLFSNRWYRTQQALR